MGTIKQKATVQIMKRENKPIVQVKKLNLRGLLNKYGKKSSEVV